jgi:hypothetical protein
MQQKKPWLKFYQGDAAYAVPAESVGGIIWRPRPDRAEDSSSISANIFSKTDAGDADKWVILLRDKKVQLALTVDRIVGEVQLATEDFPQKPSSFLSQFTLWKLEE